MDIYIPLSLQPNAYFKDSILLALSLFMDYKPDLNN